MYVIYILLYNGSRYVQVLMDGPLSLSVDELLLNFRIQCHWSIEFQTAPNHGILVEVPSNYKTQPLLVISLEKD